MLVIIRTAVETTNAASFGWNSIVRYYTDVSKKIG